jgi:hypothetical protein
MEEVVGRPVGVLGVGIPEGNAVLVISHAQVLIVVLFVGRRAGVPWLWIPVLGDLVRKVDAGARAQGPECNEICSNASSGNGMGCRSVHSEIGNQRMAVPCRTADAAATGCFEWHALAIGIPPLLPPPWPILRHHTFPRAASAIYATDDSCRTSDRVHPAIFILCVLFGRLDIALCGGEEDGRPSIEADLRLERGRIDLGHLEEGDAAANGQEAQDNGDDVEDGGLEALEEDDAGD